MADPGDVRLPTGVTLRARVDGPEGAPTVVLINGIFMNIAAWDGLAALLTPRYRLLRYDGRGQGASDKPAGPYTVGQHTDDLAALLAALAPDPVHLVGLSNGALVALELASRSPERLRSLSLFDGFARVDALLRAVLRSWRSALELGGSAGRFDVATPWVWGHAFLEEHEDTVLGFREGAAAIPAEPVRALVEGALRYGEEGRDALDGVRRYRGPLLCGVGDGDVLSPPRYSQEILAAAGRGHLVTLADAGHAAPVERPDATADALLPFLRDADARWEHRHDAPAARPGGPTAGPADTTDGSDPT